MGGERRIQKLSTAAFTGAEKNPSAKTKVMQGDAIHDLSSLRKRTALQSGQYLIAAIGKGYNQEKIRVTTKIPH